MQYKCPNCGNIINEGLNFCTNCGQPFEWPLKSEIVPTPVAPIPTPVSAPSSPIEPTYGESTKTPSQNKMPNSKKKKDTLIIAILALLAVAVIIITIFVVKNLLDKTNSSSKDQATSSDVTQSTSDATESPGSETTGEQANANRTIVVPSSESGTGMEFNLTFTNFCNEMGIDPRTIEKDGKFYKYDVIGGDYSSGGRLIGTIIFELNETTKNITLVAYLYTYGDLDFYHHTKEESEASKIFDTLGLSKTPKAVFEAYESGMDWGSIMLPDDNHTAYYCYWNDYQAMIVAVPEDETFEGTLKMEDINAIQEEYFF